VAESVIGSSAVPVFQSFLITSPSFLSLFLLCCLFSVKFYIAYSPYFSLSHLSLSFPYLKSRWRGRLLFPLPVRPCRSSYYGFFLAHLPQKPPPKAKVAAHTSSHLPQLGWLTD
jgi:hypothetical protein